MTSDIGRSFLGEKVNSELPVLNSTQDSVISVIGEAKIVPFSLVERRFTRRSKIEASIVQLQFRVQSQMELS